MWRSTPVGESPLFSLRPKCPARKLSPLVTEYMAFEKNQFGIADRVAASSGLEVVEIELRGAGKSRMLRIFIDKPGGVTHQDCAHSAVSGTILDVEDTVPGGEYLLGSLVTRAGSKTSRPADFERFAGTR